MGALIAVVILALVAAVTPTPKQDEAAHAAKPAQAASTPAQADH